MPCRQEPLFGRIVAMKTNEIRSKFLAFFEAREHVVLPSASLIPENDPSVLFNTAGMQPLVPYLMGQKHPKGDKLASAQKSVRTVDIDEIGDNTHATFFEMLGNWSLGSYFKEEAILWSFEFLTKELGLDPNRLYVTVFEGNDDAPRDIEASEIWKKYVPENRIYFMPAESNWWSPGANGPCGPDTEMFYDLTPQGLGDLTPDEFIKADDEQKVIEIWNDVFMEYEKKEGKVIGKLAQKNVDTGSGLERLSAVVQGKDNIFDIDIFEPIFIKIQELATTRNVKAERIIADHIRTAVFLIGDGVTPSNTDQGYILRRLIRRAVRYAETLGIKKEKLQEVARVVIEMYKEAYENLGTAHESILEEINKEEVKFRETLARGLKEFEKGTDPFVLFTTYGFPIELTLELADEKGLKIDRNAFVKQMNEHKALSRAGAEQKFKGGLADTSEMSVKYHTTTHMLNSALREVLGEHVSQKGSNITEERLRFDFIHGEKMTDEEKAEVERIVNEKIKAGLPVSSKEVTIEEARAENAIGVFGDKYDERVTVYSIGEGDDTFSKEICGGPHVENTNTLGTFRITKEESVSFGVRRIKAVLE